MNNMDAKSLFLTALQDISQRLECGKDLMPDRYITEFQANAKEVAEQLEHIMETSRTLKLGVVGEVKAGKSSFLNALLFNGQDVLPKAPTPMTAALTKLSYNEIPEARVFFYNRDDWETIVNQARRYDDLLQKDYELYSSKYDEQTKSRSEKNVGRGAIPSVGNQQMIPKKSFAEFEKERKKNYPLEARSCKEVFEMAKKINVDQYLSDEPVVISSKDNMNYMEKLQEYVGSNGSFTPIVKYTEIQLDNPLLRGLEVVDTPGLNDPILSRSRVTSKFLMQCDAVFLLSYSGQFLGKEDINFITTLLPSEGINHAEIIGSKFDSGILDFPEKNPSFARARDVSMENFKGQAKKNLYEFTQKNGSSTMLIEMLKQSEVKFISSLMYSAAKNIEQGNNLSQEEAYVIQQMKSRFPDFKADTKSLYALANIDDVREKCFSKVKEDKEKILTERQNSIVQSQVGKFLGYLEELTIQAEANMAEIKAADLDEIEERMRDITRKLSSVRTQIKGIFDSAAANAASSSNAISIEVAKELEQHTEILVSTRNEQIRHPIKQTKGFIFTRRVIVGYDYENVTHHTASITDLQKNIDDFNTRAMEIMNNRFTNMLKINELREKLKTAVMGAFDIGDRNFDENSILMPLESALRMISIPKISLNVEKYYSLIDQKLSGYVDCGVVEDRMIGNLMSAQRQILDTMKSDYTQDISDQCKKLSSDLAKQSAVFIDEIASQLEENSEKLKNMLQDKQAGIARIASFIDEVKKAKKYLNSME